MRARTVIALKGPAPGLQIPAPRPTPEYALQPVPNWTATGASQRPNPAAVDGGPSDTAGTVPHPAENMVCIRGRQRVAVVPKIASDLLVYRIPGWR
jgi:hypothetical protein